jgi:hypothetical protein
MLCIPKREGAVVKLVKLDTEEFIGSRNRELDWPSFGATIRNNKAYSLVDNPQ